jgi:5-methylcytosine-specific restriction endonuclease McrA
MKIKQKMQDTKKKANIPKALREQVWLKNIGHKYEHKCLIDWCQNTMNVFDFHVGHNIPESKGGETSITNLKPICARCNLSMGNQYSITEWTQIGNKPKSVETVTIGKSWLCC